MLTPPKDPADHEPSVWRRSLVVIALVAAAVLLYQITITRVLSIVLWYHWAFLSISMAMLGLGAPGVWFALRRPGPNVLPACLLGGAAALPLSVVAMMQWAPGHGSWSVVSCMLLLLVPMLLLGASVCLLLLSAPGGKVGRMYGADLLGAALAALLVIPLLSVVPTPQLVAATGLLPLLALCLQWPRWRSTAVVAGVLLGALCATTGPFTVHRTKAYDESAVRPLVERWTPTARLTFFDRPLWVVPEHGFGWGTGTKAPQVTWPQYWMEQDAGAGTPITRFAGDLEPLKFLLYDVTTAAYQLQTPDRVAVIGAGGGRDVLSALLGGAQQVDAIELNPGVIDVISTEFREFGGDLYRHPKVRAVVSEGRSHLTRTDAKYDVVQISLIDSWAATAAGAYSLSENNLYTVEAYELYWSRLSERGMLTVSRWLPAAEVRRLLGIQLEALRRSGVADPERHTALVTAGIVGTVLASKQPFTGAMHARLREVCDERGFALVHPAADPATHNLPRLADLPVDPNIDVSPSTDDRPFFFQTVPVYRPVSRETSLKYGANTEAVHSLQLLVTAATSITLLMFFAPFVARRRLGGGSAFWRGSGYFACLGIGFMLVEVPWLQRFVLFLGHPSTAATVVLGSMLLGAGLGASVSARFGVARLQRFGWCVPLLVAAVNLASPAVFATTLGFELLPRVLLAVALLVPVGFSLGFMFPLGMVRFGDASKAWFWAINGACGVLASILSLVLAMAFGFQIVVWVGVGCYVLAWWLLQGPAAVAVGQGSSA